MSDIKSSPQLTKLRWLYSTLLLHIYHFWCFVCPFCSTRHVAPERNDRRQSSEDVSCRLSSHLASHWRPAERGATTCRPRSMVSDLPRPDTAARSTDCSTLASREQAAVSPGAADVSPVSPAQAAGTRQGPTQALQHCSTSSAVTADNLNISQLSQQPVRRRGRQALNCWVELRRYKQ